MRGLEDVVIRKAKAWVELVCIVTLWCLFDWRTALAAFLLMWCVNIAVACAK